MAAGLCAALLAGAAPAQADVLRDLLGVNPFKKQEDGLREGVWVDDPGDDIHCPRVDVIEGAAYVRRGEGAGLSYQLSFGELSRECVRTPDGRVVANVGVDVRAVLGPAGRPGVFSSPLTIRVMRGDAVLHRLTRQVKVAVPAGEGNGMAAVIEQGVPLPEDTHGVLIEVGFGGGPASGAKTRRNR
ncbi:hypothetical protein ACFFJB_09640 [Camelimonas abortus]|uniref:Uncharacterized protein n=1 Tax=Camelimonas abortus TaxID=1017184 RepID=A0ABV7LDU2_9HYPH